MSKLPDFDSETDYTSAALHELIHASGHPSRLNRDMSKEKYPVKECIAELGRRVRL
jgi:antirestriction protein ArdC